jgi:mRNA-degrading endonuclease toxin of MazEF toxin-antitoxin module
MPISPTQVINQREMYFCEPDPKDTVGSEEKFEHIWVIVSIARLNRGNCVVGVPLTSKVSKEVAHLIRIPESEFQMDGGRIPITCVALTDQIRSLDKTRFRCRAGTISMHGLDAIFLGLDRLFGR